MLLLIGNTVSSMAPAAKLVDMCASGCYTYPLWCNPLNRLLKSLLNKYNEFVHFLLVKGRCYKYVCRAATVFLSKRIL